MAKIKVGIYTVNDLTPRYTKRAPINYMLTYKVIKIKKAYVTPNIKLFYQISLQQALIIILNKAL